MITFQTEGVNNKIKNFAPVSNGIRIELNQFVPQEVKENYLKKLTEIKSLNLLYKNTDRNYRKGDYCPLFEEVITEESKILDYINEFDNNKMYWQNKTNRLKFTAIHTITPLEKTVTIIDIGHFIKDTVKLLKEMFFAEYDTTPFLVFSFRNNTKLNKSKEQHRDFNRDFNTDLKIIQQLYNKKNDFFISYINKTTNEVTYKNHQILDYNGSKINFIDLLKVIEENSTDSLHNTEIKQAIKQWIVNTEQINSL